MKNNRIYSMDFSLVYPLYRAKAEKKGRTKSEVDQIIQWLTGYSDKDIENFTHTHIDFETFVNNAPHLNPSRKLITGVICGVRVENIEDPIIQTVRYLDKLIDELAKGKSIEYILRK